MSGAVMHQKYKNLPKADMVIYRVYFRKIISKMHIPLLYVRAISVLWCFLLCHTYRISFDTIISQSTLERSSVEVFHIHSGCHLTNTLTFFNMMVWF